MLGLPVRYLAACLITVSLLMISSSANAAEYRCRDNKVTKSGGTRFIIRTSGSNFSVTKSGGNLANVVKNSNRWAVKISGGTKATFDDQRIYRSGGTWGSVRDAKLTFDCPDHWAAALWVLKELSLIK